MKKKAANSVILAAVLLLASIPAFSVSGANTDVISTQNDAIYTGTNNTYSGSNDDKNRLLPESKPIPPAASPKAPVTPGHPTATPTYPTAPELPTITAAPGKSKTPGSKPQLPQVTVAPGSTLAPGQPQEPDDWEEWVIRDFERDVLALINAERVKRGLEPLEWDHDLSFTAQSKCYNMVFHDYFGCISPEPDHKSYLNMFPARGRGIRFDSSGINIARGQTTAKEVVRYWMSTEDGRANILNPDFTQAGVGRAIHSDGTPYWSVVFAANLERYDWQHDQ